MRVIDGMHRLRAAMLMGCDRIDVEYFDGSDEEAFCRAVELNISHGLPLSLADRKAAAARILVWRPDLSDRATAAVTGLSPKTVGAIRRNASEGVAQRRERLGSDGRRRPLNGLEGRRRAAEVIVSRPGASLREIAATAGISPGTARRVRAQLAAGRDVIDGRHPGNKALQGTGQPAATGSEAPAASRAGVSRPGAASPDIDSLLQKLRNDPSLRHSEEGRALLRWLHAHTLSDNDLDKLNSAIPSHSVPLIASLARLNVKKWERLAAELERRSKVGAH
jgi:ParB-like chromosome segregation protein Spo0J